MPDLDRLVPILHVASVTESVRFYQSLGFEGVHILTSDDVGPDPHWARLKRGSAEVMVALATAPVVASQQAVMLYLYVDDVQAYRDTLSEAGAAVGRLERPDYSPAGEFRIVDPDGYSLLVGEG